MHQNSKSTISQSFLTPEPKPRPAQTPSYTKSESNPSILNKKTKDQEEFFKEVVGPVLIAGLSELCVNRPKDPIEYLGQWLIRYRYNQELKRRDLQTLLEHLDIKEEFGQGDKAIEIVAEGFTPKHPQKPLWYGGASDITYRPQRFNKSKPIGKVPLQKSSQYTVKSMPMETPSGSNVKTKIPETLNKGQSRYLASTSASASSAGKPAANTKTKVHLAEPSLKPKKSKAYKKTKKDTEHINSLSVTKELNDGLGLDLNVMKTTAMDDGEASSMSESEEQAIVGTSPYGTGTLPNFGEVPGEYDD